MDTILHRLARWAKEDPQAVAQRYLVGDAWKEITAKEFCDRVYYLALYLESIGFNKSETSIMHSVNCPQWVHVDLACVLLGAKSAGLYPNSNTKDLRYILEHTEATMLSVQNKDFFKKIVGPDYALPSRIRKVIVFDGDTSISPNAVSYEDAVAAGRAIARSTSKKKLSEYLAALDPDAGLFMIYTSGATGTPKGALLSLDNFTFTADIAGKFWELPKNGGTLFSFLPLCHVAEKMQNIAVGLSFRYAVSFATKIDNVSVELPLVQPTLLLSVPRLWEKMMEGVLSKVENAPPLKRKLARWALDVGARVAAAKYAGKIPNPIDLAQYQVADRLVLSGIRQAMGLAKAKRLASGAAALPPHVSRWFRSLGLEILEDYGQTESTGVVCMTIPGVECAGTVGKAVPGIEVKIAEDGEILTRGRHVFKGYFKDEAATEKTIIDGWLHTGDLGEVTNDLIRIKGRKKEILKTSGGKMIAPLPIEEELKASPAIGQVCIVGDGRKYLSALITLSETKLAELKAAKAAFSERIVTDEMVIAEIKVAIDGVNKTLASYEQVKRFTVLSRDFSIVDGEMTPTLKMKRNVIETRYRDLIDQMYA